jgi:pimeloyl-ACP methyl ester carboxylesterase
MTEWRDGRTGAIAWREVGDGPPVLVVHGSMQSGMSQRDLALALADRFRVVLPDRRGRGASGPLEPDWTPAADVADVRALLDATGATRAIGISSGALLLLEVALTTELERLVAFEPPLMLDPAAPTDWVEQVEAELARGDVPAALVTGMRAAEMGPGFIRRLPRPVLERMTRKMMGRNTRDVPGFGELAATLPYDGRIVVAAIGTLDRFRAVTAPTLLVGGEHSPRYLREALAALERTLPDAKRVTVPGVDHGATENADRRGKPDRVAAELLTFL